MSKTRFKFCKKPAKTVDTGSWIKLRKGDKDNVDLIAAIDKSRLNDNKQAIWQNYAILSTSLYINPKLEDRFSAKEKELEDALGKKPSQMFAFGLVKTRTDVDEVCDKGLFFRQCLHVPLGSENKGVNVARHADTLLSYAFMKKFPQPWLIVYRIMVGCSKTLKPRFTKLAPQINPSQNFDSHVCKDVDSKPEFSCEQLNQSQIFLFELDKQGRAVKRPRHCLPYAVISYNQRDVPLTLTPSTSIIERQRRSSSRRDSSSDNSSKHDENGNTSDGRDHSSHSEMPNSSQEDDAVLSTYLEQEAMTLDNLNSMGLDSKLDDIKRQRERVMLKLKAIQNMKEVLTSTTSCSSESDHEMDKNLQMLRASSSSQGQISPTKLVNLSSSERKVEVGHVLAKRLEIQRRRRSSSGGRNDPYHWSPTKEPTATQVGNGYFSSDDLPQESSHDGQEHSRDDNDYEYYNNDEQGDMFDLDEMMYTSQGKFAGKTCVSKPKVSSEPGRFKDGDESGRFNDGDIKPHGNDQPGRFKDDVNHQVGDELARFRDDDANQPCRFRDDVVNLQVGDELGRLRDDDANQPGSGRYRDDVVKSRVGPGSFRNGDVNPQVGDEVDRFRDDDVKTQVGDELEGFNEGEIKPDFDNGLDRFIRESDDGVLKREVPNTNISDDLCSPHQNKFNQNESNGHKQNKAGGDNQYTSDSLVKDMDIDESSQSSNSGMSFQDQPPNSNSVYTVKQPNIEFKSPTEFFHEQRRTPIMHVSPQGLPLPSYQSHGIPPENGSIQRMGAIVSPRMPVDSCLMPTHTSPQMPTSLTSCQMPSSFTSPPNTISSYMSNHCPIPPVGHFNDSYRGATPLTTYNLPPGSRIKRNSGSSHHSGSPTKFADQDYLQNRSNQKEDYTSPNQINAPRISPLKSQDFSNSLYNRLTGSVERGPSSYEVDYTPSYSSINFQNLRSVSPDLPPPPPPPPASQVFTNSVFNISGAMPTNIDISLQQQSIPHSNSQYFNPDDALGDNSYPASNHSSNDTPRSDFNQLVSRGTDGRLKLGSSSTSSSIASSTFPRPPSPSSEYPYTEGQMSPSGPVVPYYEYENNVLKPQSSSENSQDTNSINPPTGMNEVPKGEGPKLSEGQLSAIVALQHQLTQTTNATQRCALQVALNTLIGVKSGDISLTSPSSAATTAVDSQPHVPKGSDNNLQEKPSQEPKTTKSKPKVIKMFYGHPLIKRGKKPPRRIEFEPVPDGPVLVDPRPVRSTLLGSKFEVSLENLPWFERKRKSQVKEQPIIANDTDYTEMDCNTVTDPQQNLRDPRIRKQIMTDVLLAVTIVKDSEKSKPQPTEPHASKSDTMKQSDPQRAKSNICKKQNEQQYNPEDPTKDDDDIVLLSVHRAPGRETPESGEITDDSPVRIKDTRTVVLTKREQRGKMEAGSERMRDRGRDGQQSREGVRGRDRDGQQSKILNKFKYVQNIDASIPDLSKSRKVEVKSHDTVFDRLGNKRKWKGDINQNFDLRQKISGQDLRQKISAKKSDAVTGYEFLHDETSNDSSVMEITRWSPPPQVSTSESFADSFKWYDRKPTETVSPKEFDNPLGRSPERGQSSYASELDSYRKDRDALHDQAERDRRWSTDGFFNKEWDIHNSGRTRSNSGDRNTDARRKDSYDNRHRYGDRRDRYTKDDPRYTVNRGISRERSPQRNSRNIWSRKDGSYCDTSRTRDSRSRNSLPRDTRSLRSPSRDRRSRRSLSKERPAYGRSSRDCSPTRSISRSSQGNNSQRSFRRSTSRERCPQKNERLPQSTREKIRYDGKTQLSRSTSVAPSCLADLLSDISSTSDNNAKEDSDKSVSLDDRLEKEHGIIPAKKMKLTKKEDIQKKPNTDLSYKNLRSSVASLKHKVAQAARSFRDLDKQELLSRIETYQERYKNLQDMAIKALECHYEGDRVPTDADRDTQQSLLEMITDIEYQREGLDKYKTNDAKVLESKMGTGVVNKATSDVTSQMYKITTKSPARSTSGSSQKKRLP